ncbi:MAG: hypothetical protein ERJ69_02105, partial [Aphanocapsa feldmannii 288cV]
QREGIRRLRQELSEELDAIYTRAFDRIGETGLGEGGIARLTQLLLRSRDGALLPLQEEIEAPLITRAPDPQP